MKRSELSDAIMEGLREGQSNESILDRVKEVAQKLESFIEDQKNFNNPNDFLEKYFSYNDLAQTINDISNKEYYYALTSIDDFLLRGKTFEQPLSCYELYIVKSMLDGILMVEKN